MSEVLAILRRPVKAAKRGANRAKRANSHPWKLARLTDDAPRPWAPPVHTRLIR